MCGIFACLSCVGQHAAVKVEWSENCFWHMLDLLFSVGQTIWRFGAQRAWLEWWCCHSSRERQGTLPFWYSTSDERHSYTSTTSMWSQQPTFRCVDVKHVKAPPSFSHPLYLQKLVRHISIFSHKKQWVVIIASNFYSIKPSAQLTLITQKP